ncbi:NADPH-dependent FMN reductase [Cohnella zeiphila]|uniref:NAD(P)H-dependent oxidoreductase n=1 Tax=Cohnella zeiphila TaxID=2761120 RepID=A0A7X0VYD5_9BACL|nr:NADPH-dependent FMN reductase [Cohnella zeiphila]MBB6734590.1 NAD(P)H-dependent oxidoreductase [Cohnella zeiphila]
MKLALIAGSNRKNASSTILLRYVERVLASRNIEVAFVELAELPLPLYSPDDAIHPNALTLRQAVEDADGLILATPEYHNSVSGTLKNALDYLDIGLVKGKPVLSVSSAGGPIGFGSLQHLQGIVRGLHGVNCPEWISIGYGSNAFGPDGAPADEGVSIRIEGAVKELTDMARALAPLAAEAI